MRTTRIIPDACPHHGGRAGIERLRREQRTRIAGSVQATAERYSDDAPDDVVDDPAAIRHGGDARQGPQRRGELQLTRGRPQRRGELQLTRGRFQRRREQQNPGDWHGFAPKDVIYASVETMGIGHATLAAKWTYNGRQTVHEGSKTLDAMGAQTTSFMISKPDGFPAGNYKVEISLDGKSVASKGFSVKK